MFESGFDQFWASWPKSPRKGAKAACLARWKKGLYEHCADQILKHVEWQKTTDQWLKDNGAFVPAPLVYLNQMRWDGAEIPEPKRQVSIAQQFEERTRNAVPMPDYIRERLAQLRKGV